MFLAFEAAHLYALSVTGQGFVLGSPFKSIPHVIGWVKTHPSYFIRWCFLLAAGIAISFIVFATVFYRLRANKPVDDMHGSARFAKEDEVEKLNLLDGKGVFVGGFEGKYLRHDGAEHIQVAAPTRAGKGVSVVVPTLLTWPDSVLVTDIKGELWELTSGWREAHANNRCYKLDFGDPESAGFNPLDSIGVGTEREISDIQNISTMLVDPDGKGMDGKDGHWRKAAHALISGLVCYALNTIEGRSATLTDVAMLMTPGDRNFDDVVAELVEFSGSGVSEQIRDYINSAGRQQAARAGEEGASVLSTAANYMLLYRDPIVARAMSRSDFDVFDLVNDDRPISLYISVNPADKTRLMPAIRLTLTVILRSLTRELDFENGRSVSAYARRLLLLLDEFPALGKLDVITDTIAFMASYGLKTMMIIQDYSQLWDIYGRNESLTANCHVRTVFAPNTHATAQVISSMTGQTTVVKRIKEGVTKIKMLAPLDDKYNEVSRPLMTPEEVMRLKSVETNGSTAISGGELLIFVAGNHVIKGTQPLYFLDKYLNARAQCGRAQNN